MSDLGAGARPGLLSEGGEPWPESLEIPRSGPVAGEVEVPPSKSLSHRCLALALLSGRRTRVDRLLRAEDTDLFLGVLEALGWTVSRDERGVDLEPPSVSERAAVEEETIELYCGNAGTLYRFLVAALSTQRGRFRVDGAARLRERPIGVLAEAMAELGVEVRWLREKGFAPLEIVGPTLMGGRTTLDASESSQYLSALLLAGLRAQSPLEIEVTSLASAPYVGITLEILERLGLEAAVRVEGDRYFVSPVTSFGSSRLVVEGDWSAAAYPAAAAAITAGSVRLRGLRRDSVQGDRRFMEILATMGASVVWEGEDLRVQGPASLLAPGDVDMGDIPDQVPTVAALAAVARGTTRILGVPHLRIKESDRLHAMATELGRLGVVVSEQPEGLTLEGREWLSEPPTVRVATYDDHRIAMSLTILGLRRGAVEVERPEVVGKSYPEFFRDLDRLVVPRRSPGVEPEPDRGQGDGRPR